VQPATAAATRRSGGAAKPAAGDTIYDSHMSGFIGWQEVHKDPCCDFLKSLQFILK